MAFLLLSRSVSLAGVLPLALLGLAACSAGGAVESKGSDVFEVKVSQLFVTVSNRSGLSLLDVRVVVEPVGGATIFTTTYPRLDPGQKRDFSLGAFRGRDGTPLNLRVVKPKLVQVSATDTQGQAHEAQVPWR